MKKKLSLTLAALSLFIIGTGCSEDEYRFRLSDDPGYVTDPVGLTCKVPCLSYPKIL